MRPSENKNDLSLRSAHAYVKNNCRLYLGENPLRSALWQEPSIQNARNLANNLEVTCETSDGWPIQKPHKWVNDQQSAHYSRLNDYNTASPRTRSTTRRPFKA